MVLQPLRHQGFDERFFLRLLLWASVRDVVGREGV
jgi:hypothetical protein